MSEENLTQRAVSRSLLNAINNGYELRSNTAPEDIAVDLSTFDSQFDNLDDSGKLVPLVQYFLDNTNIERYRVEFTTEAWDRLTKEEKIRMLREDIVEESKWLGLTPEQILQCEYETYGAMSIFWQGYVAELQRSMSKSQRQDWIEHAQEIYYDHFIDNGWMPRPLIGFQEADVPADLYNAAGSLSGAFIHLAAVDMDLPDEIIEV